MALLSKTLLVRAKAVGEMESVGPQIRSAPSPGSGGGDDAAPFVAPATDHVMMIDIFNHFMPKAYLDRLGTLIPGHVVLAAFPRLATLWDIDARLALLDGFDGLQQVLSLANPPLELIAGPQET